MQSNWLDLGLPLKEETGGRGKANKTSMDQVLSEGPESLYLLLTQGQIHSPKLFYERIFLSYNVPLYGRYQKFWLEVELILQVQLSLREHVCSFL